MTRSAIFALCRGQLFVSVDFVAGAAGAADGVLDVSAAGAFVSVAGLLPAASEEVDSDDELPFEA